MHSRVFQGLFVAFALLNASCNQPIPGAQVGTLSLESPSTSDIVTGELNKVVSCKRDIDNSVLNIELTDADEVANLKLRITGFKSNPQAYTCTQAFDNKATGSLGSKFETCFVSVRIPSSSSGSGVNAYSMHRDETQKAQTFIYDGSCQIQIVDISADVKGKIQCTRMLQTYFNGAPRNPVDQNVTANLNATFNCPLE